MADFEELRRQLQQARTGRARADQDLLLAKERGRSLAARQAAVDRSFDPREASQADIGRVRQGLLADVAAAAETLAQRQAAQVRAAAGLAAAEQAFAAVSDPRQAVASWSDEQPVLLLPYRMEIRFKTVTAPVGIATAPAGTVAAPLAPPRQPAAPAATVNPAVQPPGPAAGRPGGGPVPVTTRDQLWVRVYPDTCSIDTFEPTLAAAEVADAQLYWEGLWKAGGVEDQQRGAWRGLVASHGSGRAAWIVADYKPLNPGDQPAKANPDDVILVVPATVPLALPAEKVALSAYWTAVWLADGGKAGQDAARAALEAGVGAARAAELVAQYPPANLADAPAPPQSKRDVAVSVAFLVFPQDEDLTTRGQSWSSPARVALLPDRFVLLAYAGAAPPVVVLGNPIPSSLACGPDPSASPADQLQQSNGDIQVPDEMKWMVDFDRAVASGMGFRLDLDQTQAASGFDRLLLLGLRLSSDETTAAGELAELLAHHQNGRAGLSLVAQGTPTKNTESAASALTRYDDPDASFDDAKRGELFTSSADWLEKPDGQWLAELLGLDPQAFEQVHGSGGTDQADARAMNTALWPATLGYWMKSMMQPVFGNDPAAVDAAEEATRLFFNSFVSGRGMVPALRIGNQPYGILPASALSRLAWLSPRRRLELATGGGSSAFLARLYGVLAAMRADWRTLSSGVSNAAAPGADAERTLLDILGLHSGSVDFAQRYAESADQLLNELNLSGLGALLGDLVLGGLVQGGMDLLARLGYPGAARPDLLNRFFLGQQNTLQGPLVDDRPRSETAPIRAYTPTPDSKNYIAWLIAAAGTSFEALRREDGFTGGRPPNALLYLLLRHALQLGFYDTGVQLHEQAGLLTAAESLAARREAPFIHVKPQAPRSESRYQPLYATEVKITGSPTLTVAESIVRTLPLLPLARPLRAQLRALGKLAGASTARLERLLTEHIDCCSYRLDAWLLGLVHCQLAAMRGLSDAGAGTAAAAGGANGGLSPLAPNAPNVAQVPTAPPMQTVPPVPTVPALSTTTPRRGICLGAYSWLEHVRPQPRQLSPVQLDPDLEPVFNRPGDSPLLRDSANEGYIHAPSLNQAVTAAVLRNGFKSNASPQNRQTLAVNLTSERVRTALSFLEGIRGGQSVGALLGYQFERGLHDRYTEAEVDQFIYKIRKAFPLAGDRLASTATDASVPIEAVEARNVVDGLAFVQYVQSSGQSSYPFGKDLPPADLNQRSAIEAEVRRMLDSHDAIADVAVAEGVFHAVQGNYDRVAATLDAYSKGNFPPQPDVTRTPPTGIGLTQRVALHLDASADPAASPLAGLGMTPRAQVDPALNAWLALQLPALDQVGIKVSFVAAASGAPSPPSPLSTAEVTLRDLGLQPIDLLAIVRDENQQAMAELDDRVVRHVFAALGPRPDGGVAISYQERLAARLSLFELLPLLRNLRRLVFSSRPLAASDLALQTQATADQNGAVSADRRRVSLPRADLLSLRGSLAAFQTTLAGPLADLPNRLGDVVASIDAWIDTTVALFETGSRFALPQTGWGFAYAWRQGRFQALLAQAAALVTRWNQRLGEFDSLLAQLAALPATAALQGRFDLLRQAERQVSTAATNPLPATPDAYAALLVPKRAAFAARLGAFAALARTSRTTFAGLLSDVAALLPVSDFDLVPFSVDDEPQQAALLAADLLALVKSASAEIDLRLAGSQAALDASDGEASPAAQVADLRTGAKALLGDDALLLPCFTLPAAQAAEAAKALAASQGGEIFSYLTGTAGVDFPLDTWLYGGARVRPMLRAWEQVVMLSGALGTLSGSEPELVPSQLPWQAGDSWLALDIPPDYAIDGDRLLYTAHYAVPFQKDGLQSGLLLDEWSEVIPARDATTGITYHFERPNNEAPQTMLLVTPADFRGGWQWADLVDALNETLELARERAVEPVHLESTPYARFLPATITAVTQSLLTISMNLALNNVALDKVQAAAAGG